MSFPNIVQRLADCFHLSKKFFNIKNSPSTKGTLANVDVDDDCHDCLYRQVVLGLHGHSILQDPFKHRGSSGDHDTSKSDEDAHKNPSGTIITVAQHNENLCPR